ncbi:hypothetical protein MCOR25_006298 [Pyricularia grisea]|uniref:Heme haloperoxidase family profile domain-containing protein n=1 Tax=Pyricularia grisea TaxID=148305 RepID=A0A6P8BG56_PYRGI|nr:uncharacterized protein PgNI_02006 [Pyricularia grisea]KAI6362063.1 hypothetical protein MCOR25_006298 [Pyricularia grisea]TLD15851.1 hypothetical protein PgNI_02006 [Pyricularia grisea]
MYAKQLIVAALTATAAAFPMMASLDSGDSIDHTIMARQAPADHQYQAPGANDVRSPCPMLNALANHGYLPRSGLNIDMATLKQGFTDGVNLAPDATEFAGNKALTAGDGTRFNLDELKKHHILEHDGSLSRQDIALGNNLVLNQTIWSKTLQDFPNDQISLSDSARARKHRHADAKAANSQYDLPLNEQLISFIESALYQSVFGQGTDGGARKDWIRTLFEQERLPFEQGWSRATSPISTATVLLVTSKIAALTVVV